MLKFLIILIISYFSGSINFSIILFRLIGKDDPRKQYSGNAGTSNVYRQAGLVWAIVILLLDVGRAILLSIIAYNLLTPSQVPWICLALLAGNRFPLFHGFKGGKGVATYLGFVLILSPLWTAIAAIAWVAVFALVRVPFIASFFMVFFLSAGILWSCKFYTGAIAGTIFCTLLIYFNHMQNITDMIKKFQNKDTENN